MLQGRTHLFGRPKSVALPIHAGTEHKHPFIKMREGEEKWRGNFGEGSVAIWAIKYKTLWMRPSVRPSRCDGKGQRSGCQKYSDFADKLNMDFVKVGRVRVGSYYVSCACLRRTGNSAAHRQKHAISKRAPDIWNVIAQNARQQKM